MPTLDGREEVQIPPARSRARDSSCAARACRTSAGRGHGDLYVIARVAVPKKLSKEQKRLLEELERTLPQEKLDGGADGEDKPFFEKRQRHIWVDHPALRSAVSGGPGRRKLPGDHALRRARRFEPVAIQERRRRRRLARVLPLGRPIAIGARRALAAEFGERALRSRD